MGEGLLTGRTVVVTGASRGIGRAIATACAREGARVGLNFHQSREAAEELAAELAASHGVECPLLPFDVADAAATEAACAPLLADGGRLDGWVNNAGVNLPGLLVTQSDERLRRQVDVNLIGTLNGCRFALGPMLRARAGAIVNVGSVTARRVGPGQAVYAATKGAVAALTRALAFEYARKGIRVNCVEPGPVETDMLRPTREAIGEDLEGRVPMRRLGTPEEVAELVVYLLSDRAGFTTGSVIPVDGGFSL